MKQTQISRINGKTCFDSSGRELVRIGNMNINVGDIVWTDGHCIYGNIHHSNSFMPTFSADGELIKGIPIVTSSEFFVYSNNTGLPDKSYKFKNLRCCGFVNNENVLYIALQHSKDPTNLKLQGKWYKVTDKSYEYVCDFDRNLDSGLDADAQVSQDGSLLLLRPIGLLKNGTLYKKTMSVDAVGNMVMRIGNAYAQRVNVSPTVSGFCDSWACPYISSQGRIKDNEDFYLLAGGGSYTAKAQGAIYFDVEFSKGKITRKTVFALDFKYSTLPIWENSNVRFVYESLSAWFGQYQGANVFYRVEEFVDDDHEPLIDDDYRIINAYEGKVIVATRYCADGEKHCMPCAVEQLGNPRFYNDAKEEDFPSKEIYQEDREATREMFKKIIEDEIDPPKSGYYYYSETLNSSRDLYDDFPLNNGYTVKTSRIIIPYNKTEYKVYYNGELLLDNPVEVRRNATGYKLPNKNIHLFSSGVGNWLYRVEEGKKRLSGISENYRICYMPELGKYINQLKKLAKSLGGSMA